MGANWSRAVVHDSTEHEHDLTYDAIQGTENLQIAANFPRNRNRQVLKCQLGNLARNFRETRRLQAKKVISRTTARPGKFLVLL